MSRRKSKKSTQGLALTSVPVAKRNPVAANPLLGKSGAHGKTHKADRRAHKVALRKLPLERIASALCTGAWLKRQFHLACHTTTWCITGRVSE